MVRKSGRDSAEFSLANPPSVEDRRKAALLICEMAADKEEAKMILQELGMLDYEVPKVLKSSKPSQHTKVVRRAELPLEYDESLLGA